MKFESDFLVTCKARKSLIFCFSNLNFHNFQDAKIRTLEILNFRDFHGAKKLIFCDSSSENKSFAIAIISIRFVKFFSIKKIFTSEARRSDARISILATSKFQCASKFEFLLETSVKFGSDMKLLRKFSF